MTDKVLPLPQGFLKVSHVLFCPSRVRPTHNLIHLGLFAEIRVPGLRGLGLIARTYLTAFERDLVGDLGRRVLDNPFEFLATEFDDALENSEAGQALEFLVERHNQSLYVEVPEELRAPRRLFDKDGKPIRSQVRQFLNEQLDEGSYALVPLNAPETCEDEFSVPGEHVTLQAA